MLNEVFPAVFEIVPDKADAVQPGSHGKFGVLNLWLFGAGTLLRQRLAVQCQGQNNVAPDFSGMEVSVETPQLDGAASVEKTVEV